MEGRKSKGRLLIKVSFRYLNIERSIVLFYIDCDAENHDQIMIIGNKLSELMPERNIELSKQKN